MGKNKCDCPCPGPYCDSLMHPCQKPDKHYPQRDEAVIEITKAGQLQILQELLFEVENETVFTDYPDTPDGNQSRHENRLYNSALNKVLDRINQKIQSLEWK